MKKEKMEAKKKMLMELKKMMRDDYYEPMKEDMGSKKVVVESDSEEGLKKGLSKAEEILAKREKMSDSEGMDYKDGGMSYDKDYMKKMKEVSGAAVTEEEKKRIIETMKKQKK